MAWQRNGTPDTLTTTGDTLTITNLTSLKFNVFMIHNLVSGAGNHQSVQMGNGSIDTGNVYNDRVSQNGASDTTTQFTSALIGVNAGADSIFDIVYTINISTGEKLGITFECHNPATGAATVPSRAESVFKFVDTTNQIDQFRSKQESGSGDFLTDSNLSALGTD